MRGRSKGSDADEEAREVVIRECAIRVRTPAQKQ
jgi:hypothetical protein